MRDEKIDNLRKACGTLPNRQERENTIIYYGCENLSVELVDSPQNIYKSIFAMATATWGDNLYETKWNNIGPKERFLVIVNALKGKTLPTALEAPKFTFIVRGLPRHCFDQIARTRIGAGFGSIGCRDNSKIDSDFILYSEYEKMAGETKSKVFDYLVDCKAVYKNIILKGKESYQVARSVLPMSYHHPFVFTINLLSLLGQSRRRMCFGEEEFVVGLFWYIRQMFKNDGLWVIADAMKPACDNVNKCLYSKSDGSELFSNLFRGCGRHKNDSPYSEFNKSCTDKNNLERQLGFPIDGPGEYNNFGGDDFKSVGKKDFDLLMSK